jgi:hypothetical protein
MITHHLSNDGLVHEELLDLVDSAIRPLGSLLPLLSLDLTLDFGPDLRELLHKIPRQFQLLSHLAVFRHGRQLVRVQRLPLTLLSFVLVQFSLKEDGMESTSSSLIIAIPTHAGRLPYH